MPLTLLRLVAVLVALVVPLQGMASVMAAQCMASAHHDAHYVKYTLACLDASADDPDAGNLYVAAAAYLAAWWAALD